ncbi:BTB/POZ domain [Trinorchestia longiramus]|nr:BTB/POZ domain [Trinorchestia longiramus]
MAGEMDEISQSNHLLSLKWNNHSSNFKVAIASLQEKAVLSDATIACDGHLFPVHKLVLSTCSDFFARVFSSTPCKHPVIVLHDLPHQNLTYLLSYMYAGEVNVPQAHLPTLIKAAETLQIKGLAAPDEEPAQGFLSAINGHSDRENSLEKSSSKLLKKRKCSNLDNAGNNNSNQGSVDVEENLASSTKRSKKSLSNELKRRESASSSISENDLASVTEKESTEACHDSVKNENASISTAMQDEPYDEEGVQIKEEECGDQEEDEEEEGSVSQIWAQQQQNTAVNWNNEGSSNDLSWLPFSAARDRLGLLMEGEDDGEGSHGGALRNTNISRSAPAGELQLDLPPSLIPSSTASSMPCNTNTSCSGRNTPSLYDSFTKFNKISWANNSVLPKRRMSFDGCNGAEFQSSLVFNTNSSEPRSLSMNGNQFRMLNNAFNIKQCSNNNKASHRQLVCSYPNCGYVTDRESWLKTHIRKHTGERPFSCPHCPYRSAQKSNLTVHVKKVHAKDRENSDGFFPSANVTGSQFVRLNRRSSTDASEERDIMAGLLRSPFRDSYADGVLSSKNSVFASSSAGELTSPHLETLGSLLSLPSPPSNAQQLSFCSQAHASSVFVSPQQSSSSVAGEIVSSSNAPQRLVTSQDEASDMDHSVQSGDQ